MKKIIKRALGLTMALILAIPGCMFAEPIEIEGVTDIQLSDAPDIPGDGFDIPDLQLDLDLEGDFGDILLEDMELPTSVLPGQGDEGGLPTEGEQQPVELELQVEEAQPVSVVFETTPEDTVITVRPAVSGEDPAQEAIPPQEDGSYRNSLFYRILGEEFIPWAFQCAHEADPDCELYYNDYSMHEPAKLETVIKMAKDMQERGIRIDALGFQAHLGMDYPDIDLYESFIRRVKDETGLDVCITELDMSILPTITRSADVSMTREAWEQVINPWPDGVPADVQEAWNARMGAFLDMFIRNADVVRRINLWGVSDGDSWKNGWPIPGRKDAPLWIGRDYNLKPFLHKYVR